MVESTLTQNSNESIFSLELSKPKHLNIHICTYYTFPINKFNFYPPGKKYKTIFLNI